MSKDPVWNIPEYYNFGFHCIDHAAHETPNSSALVSLDDRKGISTKHTFGELSEYSGKFSVCLSDLGINKGDRVMVFTERIPEWYFTVLGIIKIGAVLVPTPNLSVPEDIAYMVARAEPKAIISDAANRHKIDTVKSRLDGVKHFVYVGEDIDGWLNYHELMNSMDRPPDPYEVAPTERDDPLLIFFTSGTTGMPKMVLHTHAYALAQRTTAKYVHGAGPGDMVWAITDNGLAKFFYGKLFGQWLEGATVFQHNPSGRFDPERVLQILEDYDISIFCGIPTIYRLLLDTEIGRYDLSSVKHYVSAGEPLSPALLESWELITDKKIHEFYGQSETVSLLANRPGGHIKPGSMGKPTPGHSVDVVDDLGDPIPCGTHGNLALFIGGERPPGLFKEYWKEPDATDDVFRKGWYFTQDIAYKDEDGHFWFVSRADDVIKASGYRVGPFEVESALEEHAAVSESAVVGTPDDVGGTVVTAFVVLSQGYEPGEGLKKELQEHVKENLALYKYPRNVFFVDSLPKTAAGKLRRRELSE